MLVAPNDIMLPIWIAILAIIVAIYLTWRYALLLPAPTGLPILMYHKVSVGNRDRLTVTADQLEQQFQWLQSQGYQAMFIKDMAALLTTPVDLPAKAIVLTFDDAYQNNHELLFPLIKKYNIKVTIFIPVAYIGGDNLWDGGGEPIMSVPMLHELAGSGLVEFGLHSFYHQQYSRLSPEEISQDLQDCVTTLQRLTIPYTPVLAYPYGKYHRDELAQRRMIKVFEDLGLLLAFRIGNRINALPCRTPYEIQRIDIRGTDTFFEFKTKVRKGRCQLF